MQNRRDFLKSAAGLAGAAGLALAGVGGGLGAALASSCTQAGNRSGRHPALRPARCKAGDGRLHLRFFPYELQLRHTFTVATHSRTSTPDVQVELEYEGITGYGEASMPPYLGQSVASVTAFLTRVDLSRFTDPFLMEDILAYVDSLSPGDTAAKAAVDIALHDLVGKLLGVPWHRLWGLDAAKAPATTYTIGIDTPEVVREKTKEATGRFRMLKVKVGLDSDEQMIRAIRSVTDVPLAVDANQGWKDRAKALDEIFWLKEQGVVLVEQPMAKERLDDHAWLTERSPLPIIADEAVQRLADIPALKGAYSGINIKLMKCTGMREAHKMVTLARALGMRVMLGCMTETSCGISAAAQLSPAVDFADLDGNLLIANDRFRGVTVQDGRLCLDAALPGIGVERV